MSQTIEDRRQDIARRIAALWQTAGVFLGHRDAHGLQDIGVEIQALTRADAELAAAGRDELIFVEAVK